MENIIGTITGSEGGLFEVCCDNGEKISCPARGVFRHEKLKVLVGDRVTLRADDDDGRKSGKKDGGVCVYEVAERKNALMRPPMANLDVLFVVFAAAMPDPVLVNVDKLTAIAIHSHIQPVIVITKRDIAPEKAEYLASVYRKTGFDTFVTGTGDDLGELTDYIKNHCFGKISAFAGASGVGKSTVMTRLFPSLHLETGELSRKIARGKHTTRQARLFPLSDLFGDENMTGFIADTPGFGLLDFVSFDFFSKEDLPFNFPEFEELLGTCRYTKCTHQSEEGCEILRAVAEGRISKERHESYRAIYSELKNKHEWDKK